MTGKLNQLEFNTVNYSAASALKFQKFSQERRLFSRFNNDPQSHYNHLQIIMLLQVNAHMLKYNFKNYKEIRLKFDWLLFYTALNYKIDFINENEI